MKKIVKIAVAVMAIFAMTNFIACSTGGDSEGNTETEAGGSTGGSTGGTTGGETGGSTGGTTGGETGGTTGGTTGGETGGTGGSTGEVKPVAGEYKVVYGDVVLIPGLTLEEANAWATECNLVKDTDYTINETAKTITLTAAGMAKVEAAGGEGDHDHTGEGGETGGEGGVPVVPVVPVTYTWSFGDLNMTGVEFTAAADTGSDTAGSDGSVAKVKFTSEAGLPYASSPDGLVLNLTNGASGGSYNKINITQDAKGEGATAGAIEPTKGDMVYCELQGPFTATMLYGGNSSSDKTDRTAQIKIGENITSGPENLVPAAGASLTATYEGTDTVRVYFGGTNIIRIYDIIIEK